VKEYDNDNERFWRVTKDGKLSILTKDMRVSHVYDTVRRSQNGQTFEGRFTLTRDPTQVGTTLMLMEQPKKK
jgi:hypothetical protein